MTEPRSPETEDVICGEPGDEDQMGFAVVAEETGDPLGDAFFEAEQDPIPDLDPEFDMGTLGSADHLNANGEEPLLAALAQGSTRRGAAPVLNGPQYRAVLLRLGWRARNGAELRQAVRLFQRAWSLGPPLAVDGKVGPLTSAALRMSEAARLAGRPTCSPHFAFSEFACKCGGRFSSCARIWVYRHHVLRLESYRQRVAGPVRIVSGCRCPQHNRAVGGATSSQHMFGGASDIQYAVTDSTLRRWGLFAGIGRSASTHRVRHVDSRDLVGHNLTRGTVANPTVWNYSS